MRVAIADDSPHLRAGLRALVASVGAQVVAVVGRGHDLVDVVTDAPVTEPVDVALVDMRMPPTLTDEGLRAARQIKALRPATAVLVFSADDEAPYAADLLRDSPCGVGYVLKSTITDRDQLRSVLTRLSAGEVVVDNDVARQLLSRPGVAPALAVLDDRQRAALVLAVQGKAVSEPVLAGLRDTLGFPPALGGTAGPVAAELIAWLLAPA
ncbi:response regulator [Parafrankia sp. EUN1f]|uniref:response regulator n=1 Tax=Parafrankia sp. EUN1f TaxID=102897 RepID=UPI0001C45F73|nr:response regulator [Parafrankia sp. EUN1f]EFC81558.1 response regulator receiver protein [Parafrankia sp. EUN1f]